MKNNSVLEIPFQHSAEDLKYSLSFLSMPYKIYIEHRLKSSFQAILSRMYSFAKQCNNNIFAGSAYFAQNYGVSESTIRKVISEARKWNLIEKDSYKFKDFNTFEVVPPANFKAGFPYLLHIPEVALHHPKLNWSDRKLFGIIDYRRNKIDGTLCKTRKEMVAHLELTVDQYRGKIKKFKSLGLIEVISKDNKQILKMSYLKDEIRAELDYKFNNHELSTEKGGESEKGGCARSQRGCARSQRGVSAVTHISNNIINKNNKYYDATPLEEKEKKEETETEEQAKQQGQNSKSNYSANRAKRSVQLSSTVLEYNSKAYLDAALINKDLQEKSVSAGDAFRADYIERKTLKSDQCINKLKETPQYAKKHLNLMRKMLGKHSSVC